MSEMILANTEEATELLLDAPVEMEHTDFNSFLALARQLPTMEVAVSIVPKYFEFESVGQSVRGVFLGFMTVNKKNDDGELVPLACVQWMGADGSVFINAGTTLLSAINNFTPKVGTPIEIQYVSKKERTKIYDVRILRPVEDDPAEKEALVRNLYDTAKVLGFQTKDQTLAKCSEILGRTVPSVSAMSLADMKTVIEALDNQPVPAVPF